MSRGQPTREYWDELYRRPEYVYGIEPNQYLLEKASFFQPGMKALAVGDGEGRNGVWLASRKLSVVSVEQSPWGIEKAMRLAIKNQVELAFECCNLLDWSWPEEIFDVVVAIYLHLQDSERQKIHAKIARCLKVNGLLILEGFRSNSSYSVRQNDALFTAAQLRRDFAGFKFIELLEMNVALEEGCMHQGEAEVVRALARKNEDRFTPR